jgi:hypothetical protein
MEVKPTKGLKVKINAAREAIFGEDGVEVKKISSPSGKAAAGTLTGRALVGYAEVEMTALDGKSHWYPVDQMLTDKGEKIIEEEIAVEVPQDSGDSGPISEQGTTELLAFSAGIPSQHGEGGQYQEDCRVYRDYRSIVPRDCQRTAGATATACSWWITEIRITHIARL